MRSPSRSAADPSRSAADPRSAFSPAPLSAPRRAIVSTLLFGGLLVSGCGAPQDGSGDDADATAETDPGSAAYLIPADLSLQAVRDSLPMDTIPGHPSWTELDWQILREATRWAWYEGLDEVEVPEALARIGQRFVGAPYVPYTLETEGEERLVVNLRALDCVTYIENMLSLVYFIRAAEPSILDDQDRAMELYEGFLEDIRYRDGRLDGYASRLHYFTDWMRNNAETGILQERTRDLGGIRVREPIDFMTSHRESYRQLAEQANWDRVREIERDLTAMERYYIPEGSIEGVADRIESGDIIASTSSVAGLDVAHTGIALRIDGRLHLMHAPLVGEDVQISERTLAERIRSISGQDGIMVARPLPHPGGGADAGGGR